LRNNANTAWLGGFLPGAAKIIENSYAKLNCAQTTVTETANTLTINWQVSFKSTFLGAKNMYLYVKDEFNAYQNWTQKGKITIQTTGDTTLPTGSITISNNAAYTASTSVTLNLSAVDSGSGMGSGSQMQLSNDNLSWSAPEAYATNKTWSLPIGDGTKTVYVKYKDVSGNWSGAVSDTIVLDTTKPTINIIEPADRAIITDY